MLYMDKSSSDVHTCYGSFLLLHVAVVVVVGLSLQFISMIILLYSSETADTNTFGCYKLLQMTKDIFENSHSLELDFSHWNNGKTIKYSTFRRSDYDWLYYLMHFTEFIDTLIPEMFRCFDVHHFLLLTFSTFGLIKLRNCCNIRICSLIEIDARK